MKTTAIRNNNEGLKPIYVIDCLTGEAWQTIFCMFEEIKDRRDKYGLKRYRRISAKEAQKCLKPSIYG